MKLSGANSGSNLWLHKTGNNAAADLLATNAKPKTTTTATTAATPLTDTSPTDYDKMIKKAAASTRETGEVDTSVLSKAAKGLEGTYGNIGKAAIENYQQQAAAQKQQAEKAATGLEMVGASTLQGVQKLEDIQTSLSAQVKSTAEAWGAPAEKADEYVKAARSRVNDVLTKLDETNSEFAKERNFAKAHAMQASVQSVIGSMKTEERNITETYGANSAEYQQFQASKRTALATVQSNIHAAYQQLAEDQNKTYLSTISDAYTKSNMYVGFQEQQHVEMLKYSGEAKMNYELQSAQLTATIEQMKMGGMENLANWIIETPSFTMDMTPLMTLLADLKTTQETTKQAALLASEQAALMRKQGVAAVMGGQAAVLGSR